jgi:ABC-2 type transport system permease protein
MAVYKRGYERYQGDRTSDWQRFLVLPRHSWDRLFDQKLVNGFMIGASFWPLLCLIFVYLSNNPTLASGMIGGDAAKKILAIDGGFFLTFMQVQMMTTVIIAAVVGPGLIAPDLANNALPLYFSRPLTRWEYAAARIAVIAGMLSLITWIPGLILFATQASLAGSTWLSKNWHLASGIVIGFAIWLFLVSLVALVSSAWVKWRVVAGGLIMAFFFITAGASAIVNEVFEAQWGSYINPTQLSFRLWEWLMGVAPKAQSPGPLGATVALLAICGLLIWIFEKKLRPVEVVK